MFANPCATAARAPDKIADGWRAAYRDASEAAAGRQPAAANGYAARPAGDGQTPINPANPHSSLADLAAANPLYDDPGSGSGPYGANRHANGLANGCGSPGRAAAAGAQAQADAYQPASSSAEWRRWGAGGGRMDGGTDGAAARGDGPSQPGSPQRFGNGGGAAVRSARFDVEPTREHDSERRGGWPGSSGGGWQNSAAAAGSPPRATANGVRGAQAEAGGYRPAHQQADAFPPYPPSSADADYTVSFLQEVLSQSCRTLQFTNH